MIAEPDAQVVDWRKKWRLAIFIAIGTFNTGAFFILASFLNYALGFGPKTAAYVSYGLLVPISFLGHRKITFASRGQIAREWVRFCIIQVTTILIIDGITRVAEIFPMLSGWVSFAVISVLIPLINFTVFHLWVFTNKLTS